jgi:hypothetical protein
LSRAKQKEVLVDICLRIKEAVGPPRKTAHVAADLTSAIPFGQSLIEVLDNQTFLISDSQGRKYKLSLMKLPKLSKRLGEKAWEAAPDWKKVHTLTERLFSEYFTFLLYIIRCEEAVKLKIWIKPTHIKKWLRIILVA